jgi:hypothetical protein
MSVRVYITLHHLKGTDSSYYTVGRIPVKGDFISYNNITVEVTRVILEGVVTHSNFDNNPTEADVHVVEVDSF